MKGYTEPARPWVFAHNDGDDGISWRASGQSKSTSRWSRWLSVGFVLASIGNALGSISYLHSSPEALSLHYPYIIASIGALLMAMFLVYRVMFEDDR